jgi:hypothetical protein
MVAVGVISGGYGHSLTHSLLKRLSSQVTRVSVETIEIVFLKCLSCQGHCSPSKVASETAISHSATCEHCVNCDAQMTGELPGCPEATGVLATHKHTHTDATQKGIELNVSADLFRLLGGASHTVEILASRADHVAEIRVHVQLELCFFALCEVCFEPRLLFIVPACCCTLVVVVGQHAVNVCAVVPSETLDLTIDL